MLSSNFIRYLGNLVVTPTCLTIVVSTGGVSMAAVLP